jgi:hypothetical protein
VFKANLVPVLVNTKTRKHKTTNKQTNKQANLLTSLLSDLNDGGQNLLRVPAVSC